MRSSFEISDTNQPDVLSRKANSESFCSRDADSSRSDMTFDNIGVSPRTR